MLDIGCEGVGRASWAKGNRVLLRNQEADNTLGSGVYKPVFAEVGAAEAYRQLGSLVVACRG